MKVHVQDRQNGPSGLPEKTGWLQYAPARCTLHSSIHNPQTQEQLKKNIWFWPKLNCIKIFIAKLMHKFNNQTSEGILSLQSPN